MQIDQPQHQLDNHANELATLKQQNAKLLEGMARLKQRFLLQEERFFQSTVDLLFQIVDTRHPDLLMHLHTVEKYALRVGQDLGLDANAQMDLRIAAAFHDIGKLKVDDRILYKPGSLTQNEWEVMREHPVTGAQIVGAVQGWETAAKGVLHHQERIDGHGYPHGLSGDSIPLLARIVSVVDAYDAMTSDRPYRGAMPATDAFEELERHKGRQFDPEIVESFISLQEREGVTVYAV